MSHQRQWITLALTALLFAAACGGAPGVSPTAASIEPTTAPTEAVATETAPVLVVEELEGFEPRSVVFSNVEFTITGARLSNQEPRSYAEAGDPVVDGENTYAYLDITAVNRMTATQAEGLGQDTYRLLLDGNEIPAAEEMTFLSDLTGLIPANAEVDSFLAFRVDADAKLAEGALQIGVPPDRQAALPLTGPVPEANYPLELEIEGTAEGVGPTNAGTLVFTVTGGTLYEDRPHEQATSPTGLRANEGELFFVVSLLVEKVSGRGGELLGHTGNAFRLLVDGVPRAPWDSAIHPSGSDASPIVEPGSAVEAWVAFVIPIDATELTLQVGDFEQDPGLIPLELPDLP